MASKGKAKGKGVRVVVRGQVQGVGFRYLTVERAHELGVLGWVRNEDDGTVLVHAEGPEEAVDALVEWLGEGPPGAEVDEVDVEPGKVEG
ncbi:MAG TPA: acylphosphatase, partial [Solirubrobacterales bacterium]|nr:acylphosphatase [Solirubrobacterales bacterium]